MYNASTCPDGIKPPLNLETRAPNVHITNARRPGACYLVAPLFGRNGCLPNDDHSHFRAVQELRLILLNPRLILGLLGNAEESLECSDVGKSQLCDRVVIKVGLAANEDGGRVVGVALGSLSLVFRPVNIKQG